MIKQPERVAAEPTIAGRLVTAAASAAVASVVKKLLEHGVQWFWDRPGARAEAPESRGEEPPRRLQRTA